MTKLAISISLLMSLLMSEGASATDTPPIINRNPYGIQDYVLPDSGWDETYIVLTLRDFSRPIHVTIREYIDSVAALFKVTDFQPGEAYRRERFVPIARRLFGYRGAMVIDWYTPSQVANGKVPLHSGFVHQVFALEDNLNDVDFYSRFQFFHGASDLNGFSGSLIKIFKTDWIGYEAGTDTPIIVSYGVAINRESPMGHQIANANR